MTDEIACLLPEKEEEKEELWFRSFAHRLSETSEKPAVPSFSEQNETASLKGARWQQAPASVSLFCWS